MQVREHVSLATFTTLGLGGRARLFVECATEEQVRAALSLAAERRLPVYVLGGGSNVVFPDAGFPGLVARITIGGIEFRDGPNPEVTAGAGIDWDTLVQGTVERGWTGVECLSGIPGTVGGTPIQNVGAYGQEIADTLVSVECLDRATLQRRTFTGPECAFAYRASRFKRGDRNETLLALAALRGDLRLALFDDLLARLQLDACLCRTLLRLCQAVLALRRAKSMVLDPADPNTRSVGSFFTNPVLSAAAFADLQARWPAPIPSFPAAGGMKVPAGWLVEQAGFSKGFRRGGAGLSTRHALALVNLGGTSAELLALAETVQAGVESRFGVRLEYEPEVVA